MTSIRELQFYNQALQNYRRRLKPLAPFLKPSEAFKATQTANYLEAKVWARWSVRFNAFLRRVNGRG